MFFVGQILSLVGTWCASVAQGWLVYQLTGSGAMLGSVVAVQFTPTLVLSLWGGVIADKLDKRRILMAAQSLMMLSAAMLTVLVATGSVRLWHVFVLALVSGVGSAFEGPTRQAFVSELVRNEDMSSAIGLNSATFNASRVVGPAIAAGLIAVVGMAWCFAFNAVSFLAVLGGLLAMRPTELNRTETVPATGNHLDQIVEGLRFAVRHPDVRLSLITVGIMATLSFNLPVVLPVLADREFAGGSSVYAVLVSVMAVGSLFGSLLGAGVTTPSHRTRVAALAIFGASMVLAGLMSNLVLAAAFLVAAGFGSIAFLTISNSMIQMNTPPGLRGRVMAVWSLVVVGTNPIGSMVTGYLVDFIGPAMTLVVAGAVPLVMVAVIAWTRRGNYELSELRHLLPNRHNVEESDEALAA